MPNTTRQRGCSIENRETVVCRIWGHMTVLAIEVVHDNMCLYVEALGTVLPSHHHTLKTSPLAAGHSLGSLLYALTTFVLRFGSILIGFDHRRNA